MTKIVLLLAVAISASTAFAVRPNPTLTPGALCTESDPDFVKYRYPAHVAYCQRNVTHEKKLQVAKAYGVPESEWTKYEFDHLIPLNSGGNSSAANLWPQPIAEAHDKDMVELQAFNGLSAGTLTQMQAIQLEWDWVMKH